MRATSIRRNRHSVPMLVRRAREISDMIRKLAIDNRSGGELDTSALYALQDASMKVAYPIVAIPSESNSPKGV